MCNDYIVQTTQNPHNSNPYDQTSENGAEMSIKHNVHVRLEYLIAASVNVRNKVPSSGDIGRLLNVNGTVIRAGDIV